MRAVLLSDQVVSGAKDAMTGGQPNTFDRQRSRLWPATGERVVEEIVAVPALKNRVFGQTNVSLNLNALGMES